MIDSIKVVRVVIIAVLLSIVQIGRADNALISKLEQYCPECASRLESATGAYILEFGEEALISRAWLTQNATQSIDVQYFIWSTHNNGI